MSTTSKCDPELDSWRREWQSGTPALPDLSQLVARQSHRMRLILAAEVAVTVSIGGGAVAWAPCSHQADVLVLAVAVWSFLAAAWIFAARSRRGLWSPSAQTTAAFVELSIRRCRSALAAANFGVGLYFAEILFCLAWIYHRKFTQTPPFAWTFLLSAPVILVAAATPLFLAAITWYRRGKRSELTYLLNLGLEKAATPPALTQTSWPDFFMQRLREFRKLRSW